MSDKIHAGGQVFTGELVSEPSSLELLAEAILEGRFSVRQSMPSRNQGIVTYRFVVEPKAGE